ncbi:MULTISPECIES: DDE-type integrase/transposase/recombinase [Pseudomonas]|uniref:DDE-type integrase/transposase/recombinase n=1 Tax=Pseudomonas TaxID=286 RepID=UPI0015F94576|nr:MULTISPECIES: DDE-type integrase/transposase/recombinase [Pseudomonas]MBA6136273.1 DDE-type integrase/transposase/recombinase [Pseudomonas monteilii]MBP2272937.1 putative transposase [Pseudomonas sp. BP6]MBP2288091.1 putative transposase [Pseudomonas sp. BP7]WRW01799.1 DDE-type integrase/transposase/recombinase [Pseudomonas putida]HDS1696165.1 DDE-type integrase/transposase/recombinase [Pseudomonas putida]
MKMPLEIKTGEHYLYCGQPYQVIEISGDRVQLRSLRSASDIRYLRLPNLRDSHQKGNLKKIQDAPLNSERNRVISALAPSQVGELTRRLHYLNALLQNRGGSLPSGAGYIEWIATVAEELQDSTPPSRTTLYEWKRKYLLAGRNCLALVDVRARVRSSPFERLPEQIKEIIRHYIKLHYKTTTPYSQVALFSEISDAIDDLNSHLPKLETYRVPSNSTLYRILVSWDRYEIDRAQLGPDKANKLHYWGRAFFRQRRLLQYVEADTQQLHIFAVDNYGEVIGRPYLTIFIEVKTRWVIGWDISFNPPSIDSTLKALRNSIHEDNPRGGLAMCYRTDNGAENIAEDLKIKLHWQGAKIWFCPPKTPNQKPFAESFFKVWSIQIVHHLMGTTLSNAKELGDYNPEKEAGLTIENIREGFARWLNEDYGVHPHSGIGGISPLAAWDEAIKMEFTPRKYSEEDLRMLFWACETVTPYANGRVRHNYLFWTGSPVQYLKNRQPHSDYLYLYYDRSDLGKAWLVHPAYQDDPLELEAVHPEYQVGLNMDMHEHILKELRPKDGNLNIAAAQRARAAILEKLQNQGSKSARLNHHRAAEKGLLAEDAKANMAPDDTAKMQDHTRPYHYYSNTPDLYSIVEIPHDRKR